jgi:hypothetical protein
LTELKLNTDTFLTRAFLFCVSLLPVINLFWQTDFVLLKANWLLYPVIIVSIFLSVLLRKKISFLFMIVMLTAFFYTAVFILNGGQLESVLRLFFSLLPVALLPQIRSYQHTGTIHTFLVVYFLAVLVPVYFSYLQLQGKIPYYEFDVVDGVYGGRISGGYSKPNNFIGMLFPVYMLGLYLWFMKKRKFIGSFLLLSVLILVYITGLRVAVVIYFGILVAGFMPEILRKCIVFYYRYYLNFFVAITGFVALCILYLEKGYIDGIRGRIPMWQGHSYDFFYNSSIVEFFLGKGMVKLPIKYDTAPLVGSLEEAHNNSFRIIITFGVLGYLFYCTVMRWMVLYIERTETSVRMKFIYFSCFFFLILYSITNEPVFYSSIFWAILIWIFINPSAEKQMERTE